MFPTNSFRLQNSLRFCNMQRQTKQYHTLLNYIIRYIVKNILGYNIVNLASISVVLVPFEVICVCKYKFPVENMSTSNKVIIALMSLKHALGHECKHLAKLNSACYFTAGHIESFTLFIVHKHCIVTRHTLVSIENN